MEEGTKGVYVVIVDHEFGDTCYAERTRERVLERLARDFAYLYRDEVPAEDREAIETAVATGEWREAIDTYFRAKDGKEEWRMLEDPMGCLAAEDVAPALPLAGHAVATS